MIGEQGNQISVFPYKPILVETKRHRDTLDSPETDPHMEL